MAAQIDAKFTVGVSGDPLSPSFHPDGCTGATLNFGLEFEARLLGFDVAENEPIEVPDGDSTGLFGLTDCSVDFEPNASLSVQEQSAVVDAYGDMMPTEGDAFGLLGPVEENTAVEVGLATLMSGDVSSLSYDVNVASNTQDLTPSDHILQTVLIGSGILIHRIDLSDNVQSFSAVRVRLNGTRHGRQNAPTKISGVRRFVFRI